MKQKFTGQEVSTRNKKCDEFVGILQELRPIKSSTNPACFAVSDIKVEGELGVFQYYWNYNDGSKEMNPKAVKEGIWSEEWAKQKAEGSGKFYVKKVKELALACGKDVNLNAERNGDWCQKTLVTLHNEHCKVKFLQTPGPNGLEMEFIPEGDSEVEDNDF